MIPPNYRDAENPRESCKTCAYFERGNWCAMFSVAVKPAKTCSKWTETRSEVSMPEERKTLTSKERENLPGSAFALPGRRYPIHDLAHARNALARVAQNGSPEEQAKVKAAVYKRYPQLKPERSEQLDWEDMPKMADKVHSRGFEARDPDGDGDMDSSQDIAGAGDLDNAYEDASCFTCSGTGETDMGQCADCQGTGVPKGEGLTAGQQSFSRSARLKGTTERRSFSTEGAEIRSTSDGGLRFSGYASITETPYEVAGFEETFARGAFKRCLNDNPDVCLLINHEGLPLARTSSGTLTLTEDSRGLKVQADLDPLDPDVKALEPKMRRGDLTEMSFAFRATEDEWSDNDSKRLVRSATIHRGDVSVVTRGANSNTTASIRSVIEEMEQRAGKSISKANRERLERIKQEAEDILSKPEEEEAQATQGEMEGALKISVMRAQVDVARAKRARLGRTA